MKLAHPLWWWCVSVVDLVTTAEKTENTIYQLIIMIGYRQLKACDYDLFGLLI